MKQKHRNRYLYLLLALGLLLLVYPYFDRKDFSESLILVVIFFVMLAGINAASYDRRKFIIACFLGAPWFIVAIFGVVTDLITINFADVVFGGVFFIYITVIMVHHIFTTDEVTADILYGSACVYIMIGVIWSIFYELIYYFNPESIFVPGELNIDNQTTWTDLLYYSFVTMTTLGYGDVAPVTKQARSFAIVEAIVGQLYLTILVARLMGLHISKTRKI